MKWNLKLFFLPLLISRLVSASVKHEADISTVCSPQDCFWKFSIPLGLGTVKMKLDTWFNPVDEVCSKASPKASHGRMLDEEGSVPSLMCIYLLSATWVFPALAACHYSLDFLKVLLVSKCFHSWQYVYLTIFEIEYKFWVEHNFLLTVVSMQWQVHC